MSRFRLLFLSTLSVLAPISADANAIEQRMEVEKEEPRPKGDVVSLEVTPPAIDLRSAREYAQVVVTARLASGATADVTRFATLSSTGIKAGIAANGVIRPENDGEGVLKVEFGGRRAEVPLRVAGAQAHPPVDFIRDVNPIMTKVGCNATSMRRRGLSSAGKNDPVRTFGIFTVKSPAVVVTVLSRVPLR